MHKLAMAAVAALCLAGCTTQGGGTPGDPYEAANRRIFALNRQLDGIALRPAAERYSTYVPEAVRDGIRNVLDNLDLPVTFANDVLQGEPERATESTGRFLLNSTFGAAGVFDVASRVGIPPHTEDFGQTLAVWGAGGDPYLMLPFFGPSSPRDAVGLGVTFAMEPTHYIRIKQHLWWALGREYVTILDTRARSLETLDGIERNSLDFYATTRSLYRQYRANEILNGRPPPEIPN